MEATDEFVLCRVLISCLTSGDIDNTFTDVLFVVASFSLSLNFIGSPLLSRRLAIFS